MQMQLLHWVLRSGNLKKDIDLYVNVLGMKVLRHEEFKSECAAQCNGPFARPWSKTMVGYGHEDSDFVLELAFNYGITQYEKGNDLAWIEIHGRGLIERCRSHGVEIKHNEDDGTHYVSSNDGYTFKLVEVDKDPEIVGVCLNSYNYEQNVSYYRDILQMNVVSSDDDLTKFQYPLAKNQNQSGDHYLLIRKCESRIEHHKSGGRLAISVTPTESIEKVFKQRVIQKRHKIHTDLVKLETEGKATVTVLILLDADGNEICLVGGPEFFELSAYVEGNQSIDWDNRIKSGSKE
ncbi:hypothetical protein MIR68_011196 [Amoeboaphelidium protococcarum]|nr:hypothetical protein MIR68_011196 [Amoeboaphelidium protococcarum]